MLRFSNHNYEKSMYIIKFKSFNNIVKLYSYILIYFFCNNFITYL